MIVVDTNIIAYLLIEGDQTANARQLFARDAGWIVPPLWQYEFLNVLATLVKHGGGKITDALVLWHEAQTLLLNREKVVNLADGLILATQFEISAYDAQFVLLAQNTGCPLITEDRKLVQKFPSLAMSLNNFLA